MVFLNFINILKIVYASSHENNRLRIDFSKDLNFFESRRGFSESIEGVYIIDSKECKIIYDKYMELSNIFKNIFETPYNHIPDNGILSLRLSVHNQIIHEALSVSNSNMIQNLVKDFETNYDSIKKGFRADKSPNAHVNDCRMFCKYLKKLFNNYFVIQYPNFIENSLENSDRNVGAIYQGLKSLTDTFSNKFENDLKASWKNEDHIRFENNKMQDFCKCILNYPKSIKDIRSVFNRFEKQMPKNDEDSKFVRCKDMISVIENADEDCPDFQKLYEASNILTACAPFFPELEDAIINLRDINVNQIQLDFYYLFPDIIYNHFLDVATDMDLDFEEMQKFQIKKISLLINNLFVCSRMIQLAHNIIKTKTEDFRAFLFRQLKIFLAFREKNGLDKLQKVYSANVTWKLCSQMFEKLDLIGNSSLAINRILIGGLPDYSNIGRYSFRNLNEASKFASNHFRQLFKSISMLEIYRRIELECKSHDDKCKELIPGSLEFEESKASIKDKQDLYDHFCTKLGII